MLPAIKHIFPPFSPDRLWAPVVLTTSKPRDNNFTVDTSNMDGDGADSIFGQPTPSSTPVVTTATTATVAKAVEKDSAYLTIKDANAAAQRMEKLKEGTWILWKARVSSLLRRCQTIGYATGTIKPPDIVENPIEYEEWQAKDEATHGIIMNTLGDTSMIDVPGLTEPGKSGSASELWKVLHEVHEIRGVVATGTALRNFATKRAKDDANIATHLIEMKAARMDLEMMGHRIPDNEFKMWIISSLPPSWDDYIKASFGHAGTIEDVNMSSHELRMHILNEYQRRKATGSISATRAS